MLGTHEQEIASYIEQKKVKKRTFKNALKIFFLPRFQGTLQHSIVKYITTINIKIKGNLDKLNAFPM